MKEFKQNSDAMAKDKKDKGEAYIKNAQYEYRKMLRSLCPSQEMRKQAKRISQRKYSCDRCAYLGKETKKCRNPHKDMYNIFLDIDHCYEGILRCLVQEKAAEDKKARESEAEAIDELSEALSEAIDSVIEGMGISRTFARWIIMMADGNWQIPREAVKCVRNTLDWLNDALSSEEFTETDDEE